jgi:hypothetical protein
MAIFGEVARFGSNLIGVTVGAYAVCEHVARGCVLTPLSFVTALTRAKECESHRWRAPEVVYYSIRHVRRCE